MLEKPLGLLGRRNWNWLSAKFLDMFVYVLSIICWVCWRRIQEKIRNYKQKLSFGGCPPNCPKPANSNFKQQFQRGFSNWVIATNFTLTKGSIVQVVLGSFLLHSFWEAPNTAQGQGLTSTSFPFAFGQSAIWGQGSNMSTIRGSAPGSQGDGYLFVTVQINAN